MTSKTAAAPVERVAADRRGATATARPFSGRLGVIDGDVAPMVEVAVALAAVATAVVARIAIEAVFAGLTPFVLTFPAVIAATMLAGPRAGVGAAIGCQLLTARFVFPHWTSGFGASTDFASLLVSSLSLALTIWAVTAARALSRQVRQQCERELTSVSLLVSEMDHRTKNNFQVAAALLEQQARQSGSAEVAFELDKMAARLGSIAAAYRNLSLAKDHDRYDLTAYLAELVDLLNRGVVPPQMRLTLTGQPTQVDAHTGLMIGLMVNEWVTNAVKYALPAGADAVTVAVVHAGDALRVIVADNAARAVTLRPGGTGSPLMVRLAQAIRGTISIEQDHGTRCTLSLPGAAR